MKLTYMEMIDLSYSYEYRKWLRETMCVSLDLMEVALANAWFFSGFLEEKGYELAI